MKVGHNVFYRLRSAGIKIMDEENKHGGSDAVALHQTTE